MKKLLILLLIPMFLFGIPVIQSYKNYTGALEIFDITIGDVVAETVHVQLPLADTVLDSVKLYFGEYDTIIKYRYPWPSVFDQNSYEWISDSLGVASIHTYDRYAMEDWAFSFLITDIGGEADDSINIDIQYSHIPLTAWTILYNIGTDLVPATTLYTLYPFDLFDNWKLYRHSQLRIISETDSVTIQGWLVHRQMYFHENVRPGP